MSYLVDTHCWLWALQEPDRLSAKARKILEDPGTAVFLSAASVWEMAIRIRLGKLRLPMELEAYVSSRVREERYTELPVSARHAARSVVLPDHHRDPFDRMLLAQAQCEGLMILTADRQLERYDVKVVRA